MNPTDPGTGGGGEQVVVPPYSPNGYGTYVHPAMPQGGGAQNQAAVEQRYAALRLHQAVKAGVIPASVLNAHPNTYPALWRMVSQKVSAPANAQGYKDPGYWLRMGGPSGPQTPPDVQDQQQAAPFEQGMPQQDQSGMLEQFLQRLHGASPQPMQQGGVDPQLLAQLLAQFRTSQGTGAPQASPYGNSIT